MKKKSNFSAFALCLIFFGIAYAETDPQARVGNMAWSDEVEEGIRWFVKETKTESLLALSKQLDAVRSIRVIFGTDLGNFNSIAVFVGGEEGDRWVKASAVCGDSFGREESGLTWAGRFESRKIHITEIGVSSADRLFNLFHEYQKDNDEKRGPILDGQSFVYVEKVENDELTSVGRNNQEKIQYVGNTQQLIKEFRNFLKSAFSADFSI